MRKFKIESAPLRPQLTLVLSALALAAACQMPAEGPPDATPQRTVLTLPAGASEAAAGIDREILATHLQTLSADEMEGRAPGSAGDVAAREYLAQTMAALGLAPGFGETWQQPFELLAVTAEVPARWRFEGGTAGPLELAFWDDFIAASGLQRESAEFEGVEVVFVGYGIQAPEFGWDDFKGEDLRGKVLLMLNNDPDWDPDLFAGNRRLYYGRWTYKYESAAAQGAAGAIIIHTTSSAGYPWQVVQSSWTGPQFELAAGEEPRTPIHAWVTEGAAQRLAALGGQNLDQLVAAAKSREFQPVPLGVTTSLALSNTIDGVETANVGGLLLGSDPILQDEVVIYTAHYDHLGIGKPDVSGDKIYNGAMDNASGCAQVLAIARAFRALPKPPRRSILFLFVAAEEQGLLGSAYYAREPSFVPGRIAANINLDNPKNLWGRTRDLTYIGYGKSSLDRVVEAAADRQGRVVKDDQLPDRGYFYRSDQFNFAKIGVPAIYMNAGTDFVSYPEGWGKKRVETWEANNYHQPSDEFDPSWSFEGMIEDTTLAFEVGLSIAETEQLPTWNPGDEFEAARLDALAALR